MFLGDADAVRTGDSPSCALGTLNTTLWGGRRGRRQSHRLLWLLGWLASSRDQVAAFPQARKDKLRSSSGQKAVWQVGYRGSSGGLVVVSEGGTRHVMPMALSSQAPFRTLRLWHPGREGSRQGPLRKV